MAPNDAQVDDVATDAPRISPANVRWRPALLGAIAGIAFAAVTLSPGFVGGNGAYWQVLTGDSAKGEIGWFYYARDAWRFPLFAIDNYHAPEGGNVLLSDSLPLLALPTKLAYRAFWPAASLPPIYTGWWVALCFVLQAVAASRLLRALDVRASLAHLAGIALFCYLPMLFLRFGHMTLLGQFFLLLALEGYVRAKRGTPGSRHAVALCALPVVALLVHPYLAAMSGVIVLVTIVDEFRDGALRASDAAFRIGFIALGAAIVIWLGGFVGAAERGFDDYGAYSLNLLSPLVPFPATLAGRLFHTQVPNIPGLYQWEGGAYLGAGVLLLCLAALPALRDWKHGVRRHLVLLVALVLVLVFAVSNRVGFGAHELVHLPLPDRLTALLSQFRGSGRFVWIAVYALLAGVIAIVVRRYRARSATFLLCAAAILQIADASPMQRQVRTASASATKPDVDLAAWRRLIASHDRIFEFPSFECGSAFANGTPGARWRELEVDWIAAGLGKPTNSAYLARPTKDCVRERADAASDHDRAGTLYLYRSSEDIGAFLAGHGADFSRCGSLDDVVVCSASMDLSRLR